MSSKAWQARIDAKSKRYLKTIHCKYDEQTRLVQTRPFRHDLATSCGWLGLCVTDAGVKPGVVESGESWPSVAVLMKVWC
jgi:hypothetical protein